MIRTGSLFIKGVRPELCPFAGLPARGQTYLFTFAAGGGDVRWGEDGGLATFYVVNVWRVEEQIKWRGFRDLRRFVLSLLCFFAAIPPPGFWKKLKSEPATDH
jgi:hypothetical protein